MKLSNVEDAEKINLVLEFVGADGSSVIEGASFSVHPEATTEWQTVKLSVPSSDINQLDATKTTAKVTVGTGSGDVLVDDVALNVADETKVNYLGNGHLNGAIDGKYVTTNGNPWPNAITVTPGHDGETDHAISFTKDMNELFVTSQWWADGNQALRYPTEKAGEFSVWAKGDGTFSVLIERKNSDSEVDTSVATTFTVSGNEWTEYELPIPAAPISYRETTIKIYQWNGSDALLLDDFNLHLTGE